MSYCVVSLRRFMRNGLPSCVNSDLGKLMYPWISSPQRWISSTSVLSDVHLTSTTSSQVDDSRIQQHERNRLICRTLFRQMLRFCNNLLLQKFPKDIVWYYIPSPKKYNVPKDVDPYRMELLIESADAIRQVPTESVAELHNAMSNYFERLLATNDSEDVRIIRRVKQLLPFKVTRYERNGLKLTIYEIEDIMNCVRALFRLNHVPIPDPTMDGEASYENYMSYEKARRTLAFEEMKHLNEMYPLLQELRGNREVHMLDKLHVPLSVGQVVQHQQERWRGVIVDWEYHDPSRGVVKPLSDDFSSVSPTSLTTKAYAALSPHVKYTVEVDDVYRLKGNDSSTTTITITESSADVLTLVTDPHLCRIRNDSWNVHFEGYDIDSRRFRLNSRKAYEYPMDSKDTESVAEMTRRVEAEEEYGDLLVKMLRRVWDFATLLDAIIEPPSLHQCQQIVDFRAQLRSILMGSPTQLRLVEGARFLQSNLCVYLRALNNIASEVYEVMFLRRQARIAGDMPFPLGSIVRHKKYGFRGVIVGRDPQPLYDVSRWDGLRHIPNAKDLPFYRIIPDQQDCIETFGSERPSRYVCEANLEPCPQDRMFLDVNLDFGWIKRSDGSFLAPTLERFKYGADMGDDGSLERCMIELETKFNQWHHCGQLKGGLPPECPVTISELMKALQLADNMTDSNAIRDTIKLSRRAHANITLRMQLEEGAAALLSDNLDRAHSILGKLVVHDPTYVEAWNYLASTYCLMGSYDKAKETIGIVLSLDPDHFHSRSHLALLYFENGEYKEAESCFRKCLDLDPWSIIGYKLSECIDQMSQKEK
jgi:hemimethylated DNA binding protein